jgi:hypothetical protein
MMQLMIQQAIANQLPFKYVLADTWFASCDNMRFIHSCKKHFLLDLKNNRLATLSQPERNKGVEKD